MVKASKKHSSDSMKYGVRGASEDKT